MMMILILASIISLFMIILNSMIANKSMMDREKISPFECGFNPLYYARAPFSMRFFLIAIIFLIFDVEITLIMPLPIMLYSKTLINMITLGSFFIIILLIGLYHEWNQGALYWPK
uniref:NADH-ubiquinone oxidoreductase chain 3 n=1 Tax=Tetrodontophora bielanensis TaxID=48717 RepID=Q9B511_TETBI|nr:NADH dehydrogenase subunit 3 [Tetrodontophora bielanensis]AAK30946.1 NADH dehydrogenase subunit 3 [Tetrodontophora bielanensis]